MNYRRILHQCASPLVVAAVLSALPTIAAEPIKITKDQAKLVGVETATLANTANVTSQGFLARVVIPPQQVRYIGTIAGGRIDNLMVSPGQAVRQGQVLAQVTSPDLLRAQLEFVESSAQEQYLRETLGREQALSKDRVVSPKQVLATRNELAIANATAAQRKLALQMSGMSDAAIASLAANKMPTGSATIQSPLDGTVMEVAAAAGQSIEGSGTLFQIAQISTLWLELQVPTAQLSRVAIDGVVTVPGIATKGKVSAIGSTVDTGNQSIMVRAEIDNRNAKLRPGQYVEARVEMPNGNEKSWSVPFASLVRMGNETFVLKEIDAGYQPVPVKIEYESVDIATVSGELSGEDRIAVRGIVALKGAMRGLGGGE